MTPFYELLHHLSYHGYEYNLLNDTQCVLLQFFDRPSAEDFVDITADYFANLQYSYCDVTNRRITLVVLWIGE